MSNDTQPSITTPHIEPCAELEESAQEYAMKQAESQRLCDYERQVAANWRSPNDERHPER